MSTEVKARDLRLSANDYDLVYLPSGRRSHVLLWTTQIYTYCGRDAGLWNDSFLGTGSQREFDRAAAMPICTRCQHYFKDIA